MASNCDPEDTWSLRQNLETKARINEGQVDESQ